MYIGITLSKCSSTNLESLTLKLLDVHVIFLKIDTKVFASNVEVHKRRLFIDSLHTSCNPKLYF